MIHFSCDRCKRLIDQEVDLRYVVKLEAYPAMEPMEMDDIEDDRDHLAEIQEMIERVQDTELDCIGDDLYLKKRYDLCADCYKEFIKNPVGRGPAVQVGFSEN